MGEVWGIAAWHSVSLVGLLILPQMTNGLFIPRQAGSSGAESRAGFAAAESLPAAALDTRCQVASGGTGLPSAARQPATNVAATSQIQLSQVAAGRRMPEARHSLPTSMELRPALTLLRPILARPRS